MNNHRVNSTADTAKTQDISAIPPRPTALPVVPANLPADLLDCKAFIVWHWWWDSAKRKWTKPPYDPRKGNTSNSTAIAVPLAEAVRVYKHGTDRNGGGYDGIGFYPELVTNAADDDGHHCIGVDLDNATNANGDLHPWAQGIVTYLNSYTERSPSGTGVRILVYGDIPDTGRKHKLPNGGAIEIYKAKRYLTLTGHRLKATPTQIQKRPDQIGDIFSAYFSSNATTKRQKAAGASRATTEGERPLAAEGEALRRLQGDPKFQRLWSGSNVDCNDDDSAGDLSLCSMLANKGASRAEVDAAYRASGRYREKWDECHHGDGRTYGEGTLDKAFTNLPTRASTALPALPVIAAEEEEVDLDQLDLPAVIDLYRRERDHRRNAEAAYQAEHQRRRQVEQYQRDFIRGLSNPNWRGEKLTALVMADELVAADVRAGERRRLPITKVAAIAGQSPKSTSEHLKRVEESTGWFKRDLEIEYTTDEDGRQVARQVSYITLTVDPRELPVLIAEAAPLETGKANTHGGRREANRCPDHPDAKIIRNTVTQWVDICNDCGAIVDQGETKRVTVGATGHDDGLGGEEVDAGEIEVDVIAAEADPTGQLDGVERPQKGERYPTGQLDVLGTHTEPTVLPSLFDLIAAKGGTPVDRWSN